MRNDTGEIHVNPKQKKGTNIFMGNYLYIFLDEGGDFGFSEKSSKYFSLTCVRNIRPFNISHKLGKYKFDLIEYGHELEYFHCVQDNKHIRGKVFSIFEKDIHLMPIDSILIEKRKTGPALQEQSRFYLKMIGYLLSYVFEKVNLSKLDGVILITDKIPLGKKRKAVEKAVKITLKNMLPDGFKFIYMNHDSKSCVGLQIADYCNWAIWRKWERGDTAFYEKIKDGIKSEFDIFRTGTTHYY